VPFLNLKLCVPPSKNIPMEIALVLTDLTVEVLNKKRELTAVAFEYVEPEQWYIGGVPLTGHSLRSFYLDIKVTEGTNTKDEKSLYVSRAFAAIEEIVGPLAAPSYIVIHEVHADSWGYKGQTQGFRYVNGRAL
jgi:4-oxalocrotonate tautomerase